MLLQGTCNLRATFEKNYFTSNDEATVFMEFNNSQSRLNNKNIVFVLKQRLLLNAKRAKRRKIFTKVKSELPRLKAPALTNSKKLSLTLPSVINQETMNINLKKPNKDDLIKLKETDNILTSTTKTNLITSEYFLEVSCPMDGCCANKATIEYPIGLYYQENQLPVFPIINAQLPEAWNPQVMPIVNLASSFNLQVPPKNYKKLIIQQWLKFR